jgi:hypothetical protein
MQNLDLNGLVALVPLFSQVISWFDWMVGIALFLAVRGKSRYTSGEGPIGTLDDSGGLFFRIQVRNAPSLGGLGPMRSPPRLPDTMDFMGFKPIICNGVMISFVESLEA